jgi:peptide/nickel transport system substrate-binding protein
VSFVHIHPMLAYYYAPMNVNIPPFNNALARQAVAYALDRHVLVNLYGGPKLASTLCQDLPAGLPGYEPYCPYTKTPGTRYAGPDFAKAKALVEKSGTAGQTVTVISTDKLVDRNIGEYIRSVLQTLGYNAKLKPISANIQFNYTQNSNNKVQISESFWLPDYPAPSDYLQVLLSCGAFHPGSDNSVNMAGFCDPSIDKEMDTALTTQLTDKPAAFKLWAKVDRELTDRAPIVTLFQMQNLIIVSPRVKNYVYSDMYQMVFSQAWLR